MRRISSRLVSSRFVKGTVDFRPTSGVSPSAVYRIQTSRDCGSWWPVHHASIARATTALAAPLGSSQSQPGRLGLRHRYPGLVSWAAAGANAGRGRAFIWMDGRCSVCVPFSFSVLWDSCSVLGARCLASYLIFGAWCLGLRFVSFVRRASWGAVFYRCFGQRYWDWEHTRFSFEFVFCVLCLERDVLCVWGWGWTSRGVAGDGFWARCVCVEFFASVTCCTFAFSFAFTCLFGFDFDFSRFAFFAFLFIFIFIFILFIVIVIPLFVSVSHPTRKPRILTRAPRTANASTSLRRSGRRMSLLSRCLSRWVFLLGWGWVGLVLIGFFLRCFPRMLAACLLARPLVHPRRAFPALVPAPTHTAAQPLPRHAALDRSLPHGDALERQPPPERDRVARPHAVLRPQRRRQGRARRVHARLARRAGGRRFGAGGRRACDCHCPPSRSRSR
ncbi:hypothetical protein EVG20_g8024 [Dentipellis fragilis]|uniref:Uncharacterized protein n=1 Tax=Dentipellis fragilis TaxID=205917 RepID=A0A4Y9Y9T5_9AGAM|nr:hypothetical protein EVG20_g8024 [Dentipellis fragilis]